MNTCHCFRITLRIMHGYATMTFMHNALWHARITVPCSTLSLMIPRHTSVSKETGVCALPIVNWQSTAIFTTSKCEKKLHMKEIFGSERHQMSDICDIYTIIHIDAINCITLLCILRKGLEWNKSAVTGWYIVFWEMRNFLWLMLHAGMRSTASTSYVATHLLQCYALCISCLNVIASTKSNIKVYSKSCTHTWLVDHLSTSPHSMVMSSECTQLWFCELGHLWQNRIHEYVVVQITSSSQIGWVDDPRLCVLKINEARYIQI